MKLSHNTTWYDPCRRERTRGRLGRNSMRRLVCLVAWPLSNAAARAGVTLTIRLFFFLLPCFFVSRKQITEIKGEGMIAGQSHAAARDYHGMFTGKIQRPLRKNPYIADSLRYSATRSEQRPLSSALKARPRWALQRGPTVWQPKHYLQFDQKIRKQQLELVYSCSL